MSGTYPPGGRLFVNDKKTTEKHPDYRGNLEISVDLLKIIQLGLTFSDSDGNLPEGDCAWQFHFKFNLK